MHNKEDVLEQMKLMYETQNTLMKKFSDDLKKVNEEFKKVVSKMK